MPKPYLSLIIPVYNEEKTILQTLLSIDYALSLSEFSSEVIVVDDGSRDATAHIVRQYEKVLKPLKCIEGKSRRGFGAAIKDGMASANGNVRLVLYPSCVGFLDTREEMLTAFKDGFDIVTGSRNIGTEPHGVARSLKRTFRKLSNKLLCGKSLFGVSDVRFGAMSMTEETAEWLFSFPELTNSNNIFFELYMLATKNGARIREIAYTKNDACVCGKGAWNWVRAYFHALKVKHLAKKKKKHESLVLE